MLWYDFKELIKFIGLGEEALHIYVGLLAYLLILKLSRRPPHNPLPLTILLFIALLNEGQDIKNRAYLDEPLNLLNGVGRHQHLAAPDPVLTMGAKAAA